VVLREPVQALRPRPVHPTPARRRHEAQEMFVAFREAFVKDTRRVGIAAHGGRDLRRTRLRDGRSGARPAPA
jgi:hypothetical protein